VTRCRRSEWRRRSRRRLGPCSSPAPSLTRTAPSFLVATGPAPHVHGLSPAVPRRRRRDARLAPPRCGTAAAPLLPYSHDTHTGEEGNENPNGVGGLGNWGFAPSPRICNTSAREATRKPCPAPGLTSRAAELAPASAAQAKPQEARCRGRWVKSPSDWYQPARAWRLGVRAGRAGDRPIKSARAGRC
jgi:hypothetical protein